jgi:diguanylate cyclase (GGDEF)-like protein
MDDVSREPSRQIRELIETGCLETALAEADIHLASATGAERIRILALQSLIRVTRGDALAGMRVAAEAHTEALALHDPQAEGEALLAMGFAFQALEQHARAIEVFTQVERQATRAGDRAMHARALRRLGVSFSVLGRHDQASTLLSEAVSALQAHGSPADACHAEYSLITAQSRALDADPVAGEARQTQYGALMDQWRRFAADMGARGMTRLESMAIGNSGIAAHHAGQLDLAYELLTQADGMHIQSQLTTHRAITQSHLGEVHLALGRTGDGIAALKHAIALMEHGRPRDRMDAWDALALAHESCGDAANALAAMKEARAIERKLHDDDALLAAAKREQREEIARIVEQWSRLADQDALTALPNRRAFDRRLADRVEAAHHGAPCSLILFDLDHFKRINDTFGHAAGDAVLKRFAGLLSGGRRTGDLPARVGGEEFALLLATGLDSASEVAERVRMAVAAADWTAIDCTLAVTLSAGVAWSGEWAPDALTADALLARADQRLYAAKRAGRNRVDTGS